MGSVDREVPWLAEEPEALFDAFRNNITSFLQEHGRFVCDLAAVNISAWVVPLNSARGEVRLHVYEERLEDEEPATCDQCRIIGTMSSSSSLLGPNGQASKQAQCSFNSPWTSVSGMLARSCYACCRVCQSQLFLEFYCLKGYGQGRLRPGV
jgi:hypothetical protein